MNAPLRQIDPVLTAAMTGATKQQAERRLLSALSALAGDSDLGLLAQSILDAGPFYAKSYREDHEAAEEAALNIENHAANLAEAYGHEARYAQEGSA